MKDENAPRPFPIPRRVAFVASYVILIVLSALWALTTGPFSLAAHGTSLLYAGIAAAMVSFLVVNNPRPRGWRPLGALPPPARPDPIRDVAAAALLASVLAAGTGWAVIEWATCQALFCG